MAVQFCEGEDEAGQGKTNVWSRELAVDERIPAEHEMLGKTMPIDGIRCA